MNQKGQARMPHNSGEPGLPRDVIVIGASAGGVEALISVVGSLPLHLPASVFIVLHLAPQSASILPRILQRAGRLPVAWAEDGETILPGRIRIAPPNRHLMLLPGQVRVSAGPQENGHRPAVDPLFRTAARAYGRRVIGVILTGNGDDGTAGLIDVKRHGGLAVVQDPADALCRGMPQSAQKFVAADYVVPLVKIGPLLAQLVAERAALPVDVAPDPKGLPLDPESAGAQDAEYREGDLTLPEHATEPGPEAGFSCPHCNGNLWEVHDEGLLRFRCRVGHALTAESLLEMKEGALEATLWAALNGLEEKAALARKMAKRADERGHSLTSRRLALRAEESETHARRLRELLTDSVAEEHVSDSPEPVVNHPA